MVLADVSLSRLALTIDDQPAPDLSGQQIDARRSGARQAAPLVYTFAPRSFHVGLVVSLLGLAALLLFALYFISAAHRSSAGGRLADRFASPPRPMTDLER